MSFVSLADPGGDLVDDCLFVGDAPFETLRGEDSEFGFGQLLGGLVQTNGRSVWVLNLEDLGLPKRESASPFGSSNLALR